MKPVVLRVGRALAFCAIAAALFFLLKVPQGLASLKEKHTAIRQLQKQNADLSKEISDKRERVRKLRDSRSEQELEIRRLLRYQREGETTVILPEQTPPAK